MICNKDISDTAMILAAGFGSRMRPLSNKTPKPLLKINNKTMLEMAIDHLKKIGIKRIVVNGHYLAKQIEDFLKTIENVETIFSYEKEILDTGGGVKKALKYFNDKPFILLGGDMPLLDDKNPTLKEMIDVWDSEKMDELMLIYPTKKAKGFNKSNGDFICEKDGSLWRKNTKEKRPYVWLSAQIVKPFLYNKINKTIFSNNEIFDICEDNKKLYGIEHKGKCFHVGTPNDLKKANDLLKSGEGW